MSARQNDRQLCKYQHSIKFAAAAAALMVPLILLLSCSRGRFADRSSIPDRGIRVSTYPQNTMCFKFELADGRVIVTDPYKMDEKISPDIVTISHNHHDHDNRSMLTGGYTLVARSGSFLFDGLVITGIGGVHDERHLYESMRLYVFDFGDIRIAHIAEQAVVPTEQMFQKMGKVDIIILHFFVKDFPNSLTMNETAAIVERCAAKIIIPAHSDHTEDPALARYLGADFYEAPGDSIMITPAGLKKIDKPLVIRLFRDI